MRETYTLSLCSCCVLMDANGECCDHDHEYVPLSRIGAEERMVMEQESEVYFSHARCDGCGSPYGGDRYDFVAWVN